MFLSHSHADKNEALEVKNYLENGKNRRVFVDSLFWDYKDEVLYKLAQYDDIRGIKDAFTLIIRESLEYMIRKCPYFVFLESKNSVSLSQRLSRITYSAWICKELRIAHSIHSISESRPIPMMESMQVVHDVSPFLEHLKPITLKELPRQINSIGISMLFKTYQKLLGASCLALYLVGCGGGESPIEMRTENNGEFQINSKVDSVTIQGVKLNRGNCIVNFVPVEKVVEWGGLSQITPISMQDFKDVASVYELFNEKKELANIENKISQLKSKGCDDGAKNP
ncbi:hypothetical protein ID1001_13620 [Helicobacter pylori]